MKFAPGGSKFEERPAWLQFDSKLEGEEAKKTAMCPSTTNRFSTALEVLSDEFHAFRRTTTIHGAKYKHTILNQL